MKKLEKGNLVFSIEHGYGWIWNIEHFDVPEELKEKLGYDTQCVPRIKWLSRKNFPSCYGKLYRCGKKYENESDLKFVEVLLEDEVLHDVDLGGYYS
jgi:hypothetical protein